MFYELTFEPKMKDYLNPTVLLTFGFIPLHIIPLHINWGFPSQNHVLNFDIALNILFIKCFNPFRVNNFVDFKGGKKKRFAIS